MTPAASKLQGTHREDLTSLIEQGQQVVRKGGTPDQGQVAIGDLKEGLGTPRALPLRHKACKQHLIRLSCMLSRPASLWMQHTPLGMPPDMWRTPPASSSAKVGHHADNTHCSRNE